MEVPERETAGGDAPKFADDSKLQTLNQNYERLLGVIGASYKKVLATALPKKSGLPK